MMPGRHPFDGPAVQPPAHLRDAEGLLPASAEVDHDRRAAVRDWLERHSIDAVTVDDLLARIAAVGEEVATAEARAGTLP